MSLLRLAFWLGLIVLLLPTDARQQARLPDFANKTMQRVTGFCDRNGRTCDVGGQFWAAFLTKAAFAVRLVGDLLGAGGRQSPPEDAQESPETPLPPQDRRIMGKAAPYADPGRLPPSDLYSPP